MTEDNNSTNETIEGEEVKAAPKKRKAKKKVEILTKCLVLKSFRLAEGPIIRKFNKNSDNQYYSHRIELKSGKIRYERTQNIIELGFDDMKAALKLKAIEIVDD